jgi:hypothetical protein
MNSYRSESTGARTAEQSQLHIARGGGGWAPSASADNRSAASRHSFAGPLPARLPEASRPGEPVPIWLAALLATDCEAQRNGENHAVRWNCVSGRALYTNAGRDAEKIEPLGVSLLGGHTLAVYWMPGETAYTVEVFRQAGRCA